MLLRVRALLPEKVTPVEALQEFVKAEIARWEPVVRKAGLTGTQ